MKPLFKIGDLLRGKTIHKQRYEVLEVNETKGFYKMNFLHHGSVRDRSINLVDKFCEIEPSLNVQAGQVIWTPPLGNYIPPLGTSVSNKQESQATNGECDHDFQSYVGIREVYHFCTKCDYKAFL